MATTPAIHSETTDKTQAPKIKNIGILKFGESSTISVEFPASILVLVVIQLNILFDDLLGYSLLPILPFSMMERKSILLPYH
ncbi:hypothetical protein [Pleurocapsa sp. PCC 7319]|uniref:hypothetical protein n=1 Tax=Pleurocapsa sp. PCC 7319 TaxID=118161 RepID=UPI001ED9B8C6|nr:hypothetical protein [Pleurocapsa sp. PCC 7319]